MNLPSAKPAYNQQDEQAARSLISQALRNTVDPSRALTRLLFIDQDTNETYALTIESGAVVVTPL